MRRPPVDVRSRPARPAPRSRVGLIISAAVLFFLLTSLRGIAGFFTDFLWFDEVGLVSVWRGVLGAKIGLSLVFTVAFFLLLWLNLVIADRIAPRFLPSGPEDETVARYQEVVGPYVDKVRLGVAALFALIGGAGMGGQWRNWILFRNAVPFGTVDPLFGRDISFFVFRLPFLGDAVNWLFVTLVLTLVLTVVAHYLNGGIRLQAPIQRTTPQVKAHVSVLLGLLALTKAADYYLRQFELSFSRRGFVEGAGFTDVNAQLPALRLLTLIMAAAFLLFIVNIWRRGWALPVIAVLVWGVVSLAAGTAYPAFVQTFRVKPAENAREREFIDRNIQATRAALGLGDVVATPFPADNELSAGDLVANSATVRNVRLWDPNTIEDTYRKLQEIRQYYQFSDVDIDRYEVGGETRQVVLSVRGLNPADIPGNSWVNNHLQYTHGYGAVLSSANAVDDQGRPDFLVRDVPPQGLVDIREPRVYFSENLGGYAIVKTRQPEIDFQTPEGDDQTSRYAGDGGVALSSWLRRSAFFLRFADQNILLSSQITAESRVIFNRDIRQRVRVAAPFLAYDSDPYPVVLDGRLVWVQDAYTATDRYPYAQTVENGALGSESDLADGRFNYVRNSVKVTVDAYSGEMRFYLFDEAAPDPLVRAYANAFPALFSPASEMPKELRDHLRYPEDLFRVQANMFGRYHVTDADSFYRGNDAWDIAQDPGTGRASEQLRATAPTPPAGQEAGSARAAALGGARLERIEPTYLLLRLPGDEALSFTILQPFVPASQSDQQINLTAFLTARSDPGSYGKLQAFVMPRGEQIDGPLVVNNAIQSEPAIATELTQLDQRGSKAIYGQVQMIPLEDSILYVRPLYVTSEQTNLPEVKRVIVVFGGKAVMRTTLKESLTALFGDAPETLEAGAGDGGQAPPADDALPTADIAVLLERAEAAYREAEAALRDGDLATYQRKNKEAGQLISEARRLAGAGATTTTTVANSA